MGDAYLDTSGYVIFAPKSAAGWPQGYALRGPMGGFLYGLGSPSADLGVPGDAYLDLTPSAVVLYANKTANGWPSGISLMGNPSTVPGPSGGRFVFGHGPPPTESNIIGPFDVWFDEDTGTVYPQTANEV